MTEALLNCPWMEVGVEGRNLIHMQMCATSLAETRRSLQRIREDDLGGLLPEDLLARQEVGIAAAAETARFLPKTLRSIRAGGHGPFLQAYLTITDCRSIATTAPPFTT